MGTSSTKRQQKKPKSQLPLPAASAKAVAQHRPRTKRKKYSFPERYEFAVKVPSLDSAEANFLDQLRDDLQESIERVVRVQGAFVKALDQNALRSDRVKQITKTIDLVKFHCDSQRKIIDKGITEILDSKAVEAKRKREEAKEEERKKKLREIEEFKSVCPGCFLSGYPSD